MGRYEVVVKNGLLIIPYLGIMKADIGIKEGIITSIMDSIPASKGEEIVDARAMLVFPGVVDPHTHMGSALPFFDDFETETISAAHGGVTTLLTTLKFDSFSEDVAPDDNVFWDIVDKADRLSSIDYGVSIFVSYDRVIDKIPYYYSRCGVQSYKFSLTYKDRKISPGLDDGKIFKLLRTVASLDDPPLPMVHAEADEIIGVILPEVRESGAEELEAWNAARPNFTEEFAILKMVFLARQTRSPLYVVHVSTGEGAKVIASYQGLGIPIVAETCVHYLTLTTDKGGVLAKMNPPVRTEKDREALWDAVLRGVITCVGTDHGAKKREQKGNSIWEAVLGWPSMETFLPLMLTEGTKRRIEPVRIAELLSANNARAFRLYPRKGTIGVGSDADLVVVDMNAKKRISVQNLHSASDFTPYEGMEVSAWPVATLLRGKVIMRDNKLINRRHGKYVPRYPHTNTIGNRGHAHDYRTG